MISAILWLVPILGKAQQITLPDSDILLCMPYNISLLDNGRLPVGSKDYNLARQRRINGLIYSDLEWLTQVNTNLVSALMRE